MRYGNRAAAVIAMACLASASVCLAAKPGAEKSDEWGPAMGVLRCGLSSPKANMVVFRIKNFSKRPVRFATLMLVNQDDVTTVQQLELTLRDANGRSLRRRKWSYAKFIVGPVDLASGGVHERKFDIRYCFEVRSSGTYYLKATVRDFGYGFADKGTSSRGKGTLRSNEVAVLVLASGWWLWWVVLPFLGAIVVAVGIAFLVVRARRGAAKPDEEAPEETQED